jgi:uncharacterized membrane protein (DUF485 family)
MSSQMYQQMRRNPKFQELVRRRGRFAASLSAVVLAAFFGYILLVAFSPATVARPLYPGSSVTVGILMELSMFGGFWILVALYVRRANTEFDALTREIVEDATAARAAELKGVA